jgi:glycerophosphoryl diester phosphodiesterase
MQTAAPMFPGLERPLLFGHRGASRHAPESTWEAFDLAVNLGADVLEMDVHMTSDGEVVVIHDATVDRTTDGHGRVRELTCEQILALDAGARFRVRGERRFYDRGVKVSRLAEVLQNFSRTAFNIELKQRQPSMVSAVLKVLHEAGPVRVLLTAADDAIMRELEAAEPTVPLGLSQAQALEVVQAAWLGRPIPERYRGRALQIPPRYRLFPVVTRRVIDAVHAAGLELHLWVINDPKSAAAWLARGVDGIMSDDPGLLAGVIADARELRRVGEPSG